MGNIKEAINELPSQNTDYIQIFKMLKEKSLQMGKEDNCNYSMDRIQVMRMSTIRTMKAKHIYL